MDDEPVGRLLSRRRAIELAGAPAAALLAGCAATENATTDGTTASGDASTTASATTTGTEPTDESTTRDLPDRPTNACVAVPELAMGPFYTTDEENADRWDLRTDTDTGAQRPGVRFDITFVASRLTDDGCEPLADAVVDIWSADAQGVYSDVASQQTKDEGDTVGKDFLRGHQRANDDGIVEFTTIFPGWYPVRTPHVHFRVRAPASASTRYEFASQLFFEEDRIDDAYEHDAYDRERNRQTTNAADEPFNRVDSDSLVLDLERTEAGYETTFEVALHTDAATTDD